MKSDPPSAPSAYLIAGPTASGKSALALAIAEACNGAIINTDSMQVYNTLNVLTARPSAQDIACVPHHLYGHVDVARDYSVGQWISDVAEVLDTVRTVGKIPVLPVGQGFIFVL